MIEPQGALIKTVRLRYRNMNNVKKLRGRLDAIEFLDKENKSLLKVGNYSEEAMHSYHEVILGDDERIVGI